MKIGELARQVGISAQAVRFYERAGLLHEPHRTLSGYRVYSAAELKRVRFIRKAKELGFSLTEIGDILRMHDAGQVPCAQVMAIAERHLRETDAEIKRLRRFRAELSNALGGWKRTRARAVTGNAICELIERTIDDNHWKPGRGAAQYARGNGRA